MESLLKQLVCQLSVIPLEIDAQYKDALKTGLRPSFEILLKLFSSVAARFSSPCVFFDALDECEDHEHIVSLIQQLSVSHIKVMFTSRDHLEILKVFGSVALSISAQGADIQKYISFRLQKERHVCASLKEDIIQELMSNAEGMYVPKRL
jgi:hypothetical protein